MHVALSITRLSRTPPSSMSKVGTSHLLSLEGKGEIVIFGGLTLCPSFGLLVYFSLFLQTLTKCATFLHFMQVASLALHSGSLA